MADRPFSQFEEFLTFAAPPCLDGTETNQSTRFELFRCLGNQSGLVRLVRAPNCCRSADVLGALLRPAISVDLYAVASVPGIFTVGDTFVVVVLDLPKVLLSWFQGLSRLLVARTDNYSGGWPRGTQRRAPATVALLFRLQFSTWPGGGQVESDRAQHALLDVGTRPRR